MLALTIRADASTVPPPRTRPSAAVRLVLWSCLMLFVELGLIRYTGAYVVYLSFFTNFVLLASFLGVGVGFLRARAPGDLARWAPFLLLGLVVFIAVFPVTAGRIGGQRVLQGSFGLPPLPMWVSLTVIFALSFGVMASIAQGVGRLFARFEPLDAYRLDIAGSVLGIVGFSAVSFLHAPPVAWGLAAVALTLVVDRRSRAPLPIAASLIMVAVLSALSFAPDTWWSPYYRVHAGDQAEPGSFDLRVNGLPHQEITPLSSLEADQVFRFDVYEHDPDNPLENVLIVGSGSGNDVAIALSRGAEHVDAVEIDPVIQQLGRDRHPDSPYEDPRVDVHIEDGRAFLHDADDRYDLILFALPDSHTLISGQASLRLESYLFTEEAMREVRDRMTKDGTLAMYHFYAETVIDRYAGTLEEVFGHPPCIDKRTRVGVRFQTVLTVNMRADGLECSTPWVATGPVPAPDTDDHPFPYLIRRTIPGRYLASLALILVASVAVVHVSAGPLRRMAGYLDLFFMGAAFLLLETKNVVQFALLFGTTWFVNALVFAGILLTVLAAVEVAKRVNVRRPALLFWPLFASIAVAWAVPQASLLGLPPFARFMTATVLAFAPVFFANLVFAERFRRVGSSTIAFGTNLLGAMVGGVLEYSALVVGYRSLLVLAAVLYLLAFAFGRRSQEAAETGPREAQEPVGIV
ncbi:MAG TPA: spermidine synthase [Actinomycetota bacterium]|nr:spermidine synthase [Actinomycetota bacterium]